MVEEDDLYTLCNFIEAIFVDKIIQSKGFVAFEEVQELINKNWRIIQELFPRLLNQIFDPKKDIHSPADNVYLDTSAWKLLEERYISKCLNIELEGETIAKES